ncbi:MAG: SLC13 family permease, partial [Pseudomonadota bacterium]
MIDPALWPALLTLLVVVGMFVLFVREVYPTEVIAIAGASALVATGILPIDRFMSVFANPAPLTIAAMFILSGALVRTGALDAFTRWISQGAKSHPRRVIAGFAGFTASASAFMNNT